MNFYFAFQRDSPVLVTVWLVVMALWGWKVFSGETMAGEREARINSR